MPALQSLQSCVVRRGGGGRGRRSERSEPRALGSRGSRGAEAARALACGGDQPQLALISRQAMPLFAATLQNINSFFTIYKEQCVLIEQRTLRIDWLSTICHRTHQLDRRWNNEKHDDSSRLRPLTGINFCVNNKMENSFACFFSFVHHHRMLFILQNIKLL